MRMSTRSDEAQQVAARIECCGAVTDALKRELAAEEPQLPPEAHASAVRDATVNRVAPRDLKKQPRRLASALYRRTSGCGEQLASHRAVEMQKRR